MPIRLKLHKLNFGDQPTNIRNKYKKLTDILMLVFDIFDIFFSFDVGLE